MATSPWLKVCESRLEPILHGIGSHLGQGQGSPQLQAQHFNALGAKIIREDFLWDIIETAPGVYKQGPFSTDTRVDDPYTHQAWSRLIDNNQKIVVVGAYGSSQHSLDINSSAWRLAYVNYIDNVVRGLLNYGVRPENIIVEIWNEPNADVFGSGFETNPSAYQVLCAETRYRLKGINDKLKLACGSAVNGSWPGYRDWWTGVNFTDWHWDYFTTHEYHGVYPELGPPEYLFDRTLEWTNWMKANSVITYRKDTRFGITETGYNEGTDNDGEKTIRQMYLMSCIPDMEFMVQYVLRDHTAEGYQFVWDSVSPWVYTEKAKKFLLHAPILHAANKRTLYRAGNTYAVVLEMNTLDKLAYWSTDPDPSQIYVRTDIVPTIQTIGASTKTLYPKQNVVQIYEGPVDQKISLI